MEQKTFNHAGFSHRFMAFGIDMFIFIIGITVLASVLSLFGLKLIPDFSGLSMEAIMNNYQNDSGKLRAYNLTLTGLNILYYSYFESTVKRATPGKQLIKIQVVNIHGQGLSLGEALMRNAGKIISQLILYIGFFMCLFTPEKQCLHDLFVKSYVIKND